MEVVYASDKADGLRSNWRPGAIKEYWEGWLLFEGSPPYDMDRVGGAKWPQAASTFPWGIDSEVPGGQPDGDCATDVNGENCVLIGDPEVYVCHGALNSDDVLGLWSGAVIIQLADVWLEVSTGVLLEGDGREAIVWGWNPTAPVASPVVGTVIGSGLFADETNDDLAFFDCSTGLLIEVAGEDVVEFPFTPVDALDPCLPRESSMDVWSTGKKLHSFFNRIQLIHRPCVSLGEAMHLIFRRRQWPQATDVRW
jgi:hypothetical protein